MAKRSGIDGFAARGFWLLTIALLLAMGVAMVLSVRDDSQTYDEGFHITAGYSYWKTGDYRLNVEHPPLAKMLAALPLLFTAAEFPQREEAWRNADQVEYFGYFVYRNRIDADRLLFLGRLPIILLTLMFGLGVTLFVCRRYSAVAAVATLFWFATDANVLAHGRYITTDVAAACFIFAAAMTWMKALDTGRWRDYGWATVALGLALGAKFSALFLLPVHVVVALWQRKFRFERYLATCAGALLLVALLYLPETLRIGKLGPLAPRIDTESPSGQALRQIAEDFALPAHPFLMGLADVVVHSQTGHRTYLNGEVSDKGSWKYFPTAFAVKTPLALLLLIPAALVATGLPVWLLYPLAYFAISLTSSLNIGLRHLLPVYPFLFVLVGVLTARLLRKRLGLVVVGLAAVVQLWEVAHIHPHYLSFFNVAAGGPARGHEYLVDSNLDWGQDAKRLARYMREAGLKEVCMSYFGTASLDYYGIGQIPLLTLPEGTDPRKLNCVAAVSVTNLKDVYTRAGQHSWAKRLTPVRRIGYSIYIFDLRDK
jgi:hypothetical protein